MELNRAADPPLTLLYVEDDSITRDVVCTMLGRGFPELVIHSVVNGAEGAQRFLEFEPDLVVSDLKMPIMNGLEMSRLILARRKSTPIILTSAHSDIGYLMESIEIGISRYVMKPIDKDKLFAAVEEALVTIRLKRELKAQQEFNRKLSRAVEQSPNSIVITDQAGRIEYVNPRFSDLTGNAGREVLGQSLWALPQIGEELWSSLDAGLEWHGELDSVKKSGEPYSESSSISPVFDEQGSITHFVVLQEEITERRRAAAQIAALNQHLSARACELEIAVRELEAFNYTVSHDLRTPLTNINGYCQLILDLFGAALDGQCKEFIEVIYSESIAMNALVDTLLGFSRVARQEIVPVRTDLSELATVAAAGLLLREPGRGISFEIAPGISAYGDPDLLRVVLDNLLGNACKYTGRNEDALIQFGVWENAGERVYFVRDNGVGFDMALAGRLFGAFERLHAESEFKGFGIGLATVQRIIQRHGGRIWAEAALEKGATFYFTLPGTAAA